MPNKEFAMGIRFTENSSSNCFSRLSPFIWFRPPQMINLMRSVKYVTHMPNIYLLSFHPVVQNDLMALGLFIDLCTRKRERVWNMSLLCDNDTRVIIINTAVRMGNKRRKRRKIWIRDRISKSFFDPHFGFAYVCVRWFFGHLVWRVNEKKSSLQMQLTSFTTNLSWNIRHFPPKTGMMLWLFDCPTDDQSTKTRTSKWVNEVQTSCDYQSRQEMPNYQQRAIMQFVTSWETPCHLCWCWNTIFDSLRSIWSERKWILKATAWTKNSK